MISQALICTGFTAALAAFFSPLVKSGSHTPAVDIVIFVDNQKTCKCAPFSNDAIGVVKVWACTPGSGIAQIQVSTSGETGAPCTTTQDGCIPIDGNQCKVSVKATLVVPAGCFTGSGAVTGPGVGTTGQPCGDVVPGGANWEVTWNLAAKCGDGDNGSGNQPEMKFWNQACPTPTGNPVMHYSPIFQCKACSKL